MADIDGEPLLDTAVQRDPFWYYQRLLCAGAPLARQEMVTAFERQLGRPDNFRLDPGRPSERNHGLMFYSFKALPIRFSRAGHQPTSRRLT